MPKTSVHKDDCLAPRENQVRFARKIRAMETKTISEGMGHAPNDKFGCGVLALDSPHIFTAANRTHADSLCYTAKSNGRSEMSLSLLPSTMIASRSSASPFPSSRTAATSSGRAK